MALRSGSSVSVSRYHRPASFRACTILPLVTDSLESFLSDRILSPLIRCSSGMSMAYTGIALGG